ncbi:Hypothetical protein PENO1_028930 [Penicillium occitanis (nom. inval.)]|nr:Hypothetical protein PENO1_028930 [Penicillium occitanis (nom. inval.)]PCH10111.1 hypothetical protein PENOC_003750 [Penicillium occitanis (nom. inval.)]
MLTLDDLTVGDVSAMIAAAIAITHMTIILTIAFIIIAICQRLNSTTTASAATWEQSINSGFDTGDFGLATIPRSNLEFSRICGGSTPVACANSFSQVEFVENATGWYSNVTSYDSRIPQYVIDVFESGLSEMNNSVSSICDIQAKTYS